MSYQRDKLSDPEYAKFAWRRFRTILYGMTLIAASAVGLTLWWLHGQLGTLSIHMIIAVSLGVFLTIMLAAGLMGLMFLSSGSGHDGEVLDHSGIEDEWADDSPK